MVRELWRDALALARAGAGGDTTVPRAFASDPFLVLALHRAREALRRARVPLVGHALRRVQTVVFGIELGKDIQLGEGVWFVHPIGVVVGGTAKIGDRVRFLGSNTVGTAKDDGCPVIEDDVTLGAGARVLGPVHIGKGAVIGPNAVVLHDIPAGAVAAGVPAVVVPPMRRKPPPAPEGRPS